MGLAELGPGSGAVLQRVRRFGPPGLTPRGAQDRVEVIDPEPAGCACETEGLINKSAVNLCAQLDGLAHRGLDVACPNGGGLNQPRFRSFADRQERFLVRVRRLRFPLGRVLARWIMSINDRRLCRASRWLGMSVSLMVGTGFGRVGGLVVLGGGGWVGVSRR